MPQQAKYQVTCRVTNGQYQNETYVHAAVSYDLTNRGIYVTDVAGAKFFYPAYQLVRVEINPVPEVR